MSSPTTDSKPQRININQDIYVVIETGHMYSVFISKHCLKKRGTVPLKIKRLPLCFVFDAKHTWRRKRFKICSGFTPQLKGVWWYSGSVGFHKHPEIRWLFIGYIRLCFVHRWKRPAHHHTWLPILIRYSSSSSDPCFCPLEDCRSRSFFFFFCMINVVFRHHAPLPPIFRRPCQGVPASFVGHSSHDGWNHL